MNRPDDARAQLLADALWLAGHGFAVFPCAADKTPRTPNGFHDASHDPAIVARMFGRVDAALIGVATGAPSGVAVLDLDDHRGPHVAAWFDAVRDHIPATVTVRTRSGGRHLWFALAADQVPPPSTASRIARHVDTRGSGGYAIAWTPGALVRANLAPWPAILDRALERPETPPPARPAVFVAQSATDARYVEAAINRGMDAVISAGVGGRNVELNRQTFGLLRFVAEGRATEGQIAEAMAFAGHAAGLPAREVAATIKSAVAARRATP